MSDDRRPGAALALALALWCAALPLRPAEPAPPPPAPESGAARLLWGLPLDLNREDARTFEALPGIGPMRARAIRAAAPYCQVAELERVPGIGPVTLRLLSGRVAVFRPSDECEKTGIDAGG